MSLSNAPRRLGAIIAGGRATRFGGDKGAALLHDRALIDHAARNIAPWVDEIVVCGRDWPPYRAIADRPAPDLGPLGGIAAALFEGADQDAVLTIGCDMPQVPDGLIVALLSGGTRYCRDAPVLGCWAPSLTGSLDAHLRSGGDRSIRRWAASVGAVGIDAPSPLANINTRADLAAL